MGVNNMTTKPTNDPFGFTDLEDWENVKVKDRKRDHFDDEDEWVAKNFGNANSANEHAVYVEDCPKCRGTGEWRSWSGYTVRKCFKCDGKGKLTFKTSPEQRAKGRERAAARKKERAEKLAHDILAWKEAHRDELSFMVDMQEWERKKGIEDGFYNSMMENLCRFGSLTENMLAAVQKGLEKSCARDAERAKKLAERGSDATLSTEGFQRILDAFRNASEHLKFPKLRVGGLVITKAPDHGKNAGHLYVKTDEGYEQSTYLGKITPTGEFFKSRDCTEEHIAQLEKIAEDPLEAAKMHGLKTGHCSCCGRELTNQESVELGIGPICRAKWGF